MRIRVPFLVCLTASLLAVASSTRAQRFEEPASSGSLVDRASQSQSPPAESTPVAPQAAPKKPPKSPQPTHRFWDRENDWLFAAVGAGRALDYSSTLNLRRRGINEAFLTNSIVDNHPLFAGIEAGATAASIGVSYVFHVTNHHRLERWTSIIHIGVAVGGAARNYSLKTPHHN